MVSVRVCGLWRVCVCVCVCVQAVKAAGRVQALGINRTGTAEMHYHLLPLESKHDRRMVFVVLKRLAE